MAEPVVFDANQITLKIGDGASPETFSHPCVINLNRSISITADMVEEVVYDCSDLNAPGTVYRLKRSVSLAASGAGKTDRASLSTYLDWILSENTKNVQIEMGGTGGRRIECAVHLTEFTPAEGEPKTYANASLAFASSGAITHEAIA